MIGRLVIESVLLGLAVNVLADLCGEPWLVRYVAAGLCGWAHGYATMREEQSA